MEPRSLEFVCEACEADLRAGGRSALVRRCCTDSRHAQAGDLFFALRGERFDGHAFLGDVARQGVLGVVVEHAQAPAEDLGCAVLAVDDTRRALGRLAACYRAGFDLPVIAVAGSNGKTTTKELIAAVLREKFSTLASQASFNNDVGVPLTLLRLERTHAAAVLELGTNHPKELRPLVQMAVPRFGCITNIGREHLEFFGDLAGVAQEEGTLAELLPRTGKLFLNGDDEWTPVIARRSHAPVVRVGCGAGHEWRAEAVQADDKGTTFRCVALQAEFTGEYRVPLLGPHQAVNALFALAVGAELGLDPDEVRRGLLRVQPPKMRLQTWEARGLRVLDDSYNANADSMRVALQTLRSLPCAGRRVALLGDMAELGPHSAAAHREVGRCAAELGVSRLIAVGRWAHETVEAARAAGLKDVTEFAEVSAAAGAVRGLVQPGDLVLLKASRAAGLERIAEALRGEVTGDKP
jgi:UDP-N-acetylmuramoyl-tripeptide--D-alanyl-D-alanine ligase